MFYLNNMTIANNAMVQLLGGGVDHVLRRYVAPVHDVEDDEEGGDEEAHGDLRLVGDALAPHLRVREGVVEAKLEDCEEDDAHADHEPDVHEGGVADQGLVSPNA